MGFQVWLGLGGSVSGWLVFWPIRAVQNMGLLSRIGLWLFVYVCDILILQMIGGIVCMSCLFL